MMTAWSPPTWTDAVRRRVMIVAGGSAPGKRARAPASAIDRGNDGAEQRQEDDRLIHTIGQPFIRLMSSTAIEPRLRK